MSWKLSKIPQIAHFYWGNTKLPFVRYLALYSFSKFNPDWQIILHCPDKPSDEFVKTWTTGEHGSKARVEDVADYTDQLKNIPNLRVVTWNTKFLGGDKVNEIFRSDILRWHLLSEFGGLWSDNDILYLKPMNELYINTDANKETETVYCFPYNVEGFGTYAIGFLLSSIGNKHYRNLSERARTAYNPEVYQSVGRDLMGNYAKETGTLFNSTDLDHNLKPEVVYPYNWITIRNVYSFLPEFQREARANALPKDTIGLHWFAGDEVSGQMSSLLDHTNYQFVSCLFTKLIEMVMNTT
jgi:hypothetical protein